MKVKFTQEKKAQTAPLRPGQLRDTDEWGGLSRRQQEAVETQSERYWDTFQDLPPDKQRQERAQPGSVMTIPETFQAGGQQVTTRPRPQHPDAIRGWQERRPISVGYNPAHKPVEQLAGTGTDIDESQRSRFERLTDQVLEKQFQNLSRDQLISPERRTGFEGYSLGPGGANIVYGTPRGMDRLRLEPEDIEGRLTREKVRRAAQERMQRIQNQLQRQAPQQGAETAPERPRSGGGPRGYETRPSPRDRAKKRRMAREGGSWWDQLVSFISSLFS